MNRVEVGLPRLPGDVHHRGRDPGADMQRDLGRPFRILHQHRHIPIADDRDRRALSGPAPVRSMLEWERRPHVRFATEGELEGDSVGRDGFAGVVVGDASDEPIRTDGSWRHLQPNAGRRGEVVTGDDENLRHRGHRGVHPAGGREPGQHAREREDAGGKDQLAADGPPEGGTSCGRVSRHVHVVIHARRVR